MRLTRWAASGSTHCGSYLRHRASPQPARLDELGRDDPLRLLAGESGAGPDREAGAAGAEVVAAVRVAHPDVGEQAGEQRGGDAGRGTGGRVRRHALLAGDRAQLAVQVLPFAHPQVVQELALAHPAELVRRQRLLLLAEVAPQLEVGGEVGGWVGEAGVHRVGGLLLVGGPLARVLDGQGRDDHEHLGEAALPVGLEQDAGVARVDGQLGQAATVGGQPLARVGLVGVDRADLVQQGEAVGDAAPVRRVDEREGLDVAEPERRHLQDHRREARPQDLRLRELRPGEEVVLGVEPDADAVGDATAAALALVRRRLRDLLDRQPLHLGAGAVAGDAGGAGVDDVADAGDGQRRLGDVGRQHYPTPSRRLEDLGLLGRGQASVEREDLELVRSLLTGVQGVGGVADLPLAGEEHEDVARPVLRQLVDRVADGFVDVRRVDVGLVVLVLRGVVDERPVADLDRVGAPADLDDRRVVEVPGEALGVERRRGDDELELGAAGE